MEFKSGDLLVNLSNNIKNCKYCLGGTYVANQVLHKDMEVPTVKSENFQNSAKSVYTH